VASKVQEMNQLFGVKGGFLVAPAHILDPAIPWENVVAFIDSARNLECI
jgi:uroporphyrinogen decarboxylase